MQNSDLNIQWKYLQISSMSHYFENHANSSGSSLSQWDLYNPALYIHYYYVVKKITHFTAVQRPLRGGLLASATTSYHYQSTMCRRLLRCSGGPHLFPSDVEGDFFSFCLDAPRLLIVRHLIRIKTTYLNVCKK